jgi:hypothetical protein
VQCLEILPELSSNVNVKDLMVLSSAPRYKGNQHFLLDVMTGRELPLPRYSQTDYVEDLQVSPDQSLLAYLNWDVGNTPQLKIMNAERTLQKAIPWQATWRLIAGWLDNERLLISNRREKQDYDSLIVLNPFTGEQRELVRTIRPLLLA